MNALLRSQGKVMITFRADAMALLEGNFIDDRATGGTFIPQAFRHVGFLFPKCFDRALFEDAHGWKPGVRLCLSL